MFRKPKTKSKAVVSRNIRQRDEDEAVIESKSSSASVGAKDEEEQEVIQTPLSTTQSRTKHAVLSFNEQEDDDVANFKLKRYNHHQSHRLLSEKTVRRHRTLVDKMKHMKAEDAQKNISKVEPPYEDEQPEVEFTSGIRPNKLSEAQPKEQIKPRFRVPESEMSQGSSPPVDEDSSVRNAFPSTMAGIPDAKAVYEARKKRELLRQTGVTGTGTGEYIPLDDTIRLKSEKSGERARLVREDENDLSDEEETGSFYSAKKLLQSEEEKRREEQAHFLEIEQGGSDEETGKNSGRNGNNGAVTDDEDDALARWEREQIRKGVSSNKVAQMQDEWNATSQYYRGKGYMEQGEAEMDIDMDVELVEEQRTEFKELETASLAQQQLANGKPTVSLNDILNGLRQRLADKKEQQTSREAELQKTRAQMTENTEIIHRLEQGMPQLEGKFRMFQEMRLYSRDLLDCLNEKIVQINSLDERLSEMWRQRTDRLIRRRRQDVQDQYERCAAAAIGRSWNPPSAEYAQREAEREARRVRRRRERESKSTPGVAHFEGLSSDDEETTSQEVHYVESIASILQSAQDLFVDTGEEFFQLELILSRIVHWLAVDARSFDEAYVALCIPKLLGPFIRLQLLNWRPLKDPSAAALHHAPWYRDILLAGCLHNAGVEDLEHSALVGLIPGVVEKIVFPKIAKIVHEQWDPLSSSESTNLAFLLRTLADEYPVANADSKRWKEVLEQVHARFRDALENDIFVPLYSKEAIESTETGCGAFLNRQFWRSIKLMRSILAFRSVLSDAVLEELAVEGLLNRFTVLALQFSVLSHPGTVPKCRAIIELIPSEWLPPRRTSSYRPAASLFRQVIELHRQRDRAFAEFAQRFVDQASTVTVKEEQDAEED